jgi:inosine/xanthosine triphosphatase
MQIAVGSTNPVKIEAVTRVVLKLFPRAKIISITVPSGVSDQPKSEKEAQKGAFTRAKNALEQTHSDYGIGIEGAIRKVSGIGYFITPWGAIVDNLGKVAYGHGASCMLPKKFEKELLAGVELATVMDRESGLKNIKHKMGAFGILTHGLVNRVDAYEQMVAFAFAPFISPKYYKE